LQVHPAWYGSIAAGLLPCRGWLKQVVSVVEVLLNGSLPTLIQ
jgi:hypothetical protein